MDINAHFTICVGHYKEIKYKILIYEFSDREDPNMEVKSRRLKKVKSKKKIVKRALIICSLFFLMASGYGAFTIIKIKSAYENSKVSLNREGNKSGLRGEDVSFKNDPISILLLGIENYSSKAKDGRADTQIVITLDPDTSEINLVSVPRDTRVNIENAGEFSGIHRINAAYNYGSITGYGAIKLQVETVEKLLNIPIDNFITVNFAGFRDIIDALGGVTIDIKEDFWEENIYDRTKIEFKKGEAHLTGEESLAFVRMRKRAINATYSRDERQRQFLAATLNQVKSTGTIFKIGDIADILGKNIETDLTIKEIYDLQRQYLKSSTISINELEIEGADRTINGSAYYIPEEDGLKKVSIKLRNILNLKNDEDFITNAEMIK